jgi:hypothetical protein
VKANIAQGSITTAVNTTKLPTGSLVLYPNPATAEVHFNWPETDQSLRIRITDVNGHILREYFDNSKARSVTVPLDDMPSGTYILQVASKSRILQGVFTSVN